jgi:hypothetical protein
VKPQSLVTMVSKKQAKEKRRSRRASSETIPVSGAFLSDERLENRVLISYIALRHWKTKDHIKCKGPGRPHLVHKADCEAYCWDCSHHVVPTTKTVVAYTAIDDLKSLHFSCYNSEYKPGMKYIQNETN